MEALLSSLFWIVCLMVLSLYWKPTVDALVRRPSRSSRRELEASLRAVQMELQEEKSKHGDLKKHMKKVLKRLELLEKQSPTYVPDKLCLPTLHGKST